MSVQSTTPATAPGKKTSILDRAQKASEATVVPKFLIAGGHGSGKTHCMATADGLFALVFEGNQSKSTIRSVNPNATIFEVKDTKDFKEVKEAILNGELDGYKMLGVDSLNEMQAYYDRSFDAAPKKATTSQPQQAQGKKDNKWEKFRLMKATMGNVFVFLRDIPMPVAATIRTKPEVEEDTSITRERFSLDGDARNSVGAYFTATSFIYKMETQIVGQSVRCAMFSGPDNYPCREMEALRGICVPDIRRWLAALRGEGTDGLYIPDARLPGERFARTKATDDAI